MMKQVLYLGMGEEGPLMVLKFILPGFLVDCCRVVYPKMATNYIPCALAGVIGSASRSFTVLITDALVGMEWSVVLNHALVASFTGMIFGGFGAVMVPPIIRRLEAHQLLHPERESRG